MEMGAVAAQRLHRRDAADRDPETVLLAAAGWRREAELVVPPPGRVAALGQRGACCQAA